MHTTINSRFKKVLKLQIHLHEAFFSDERFLDSLHKSFLNQTTLDLRKEKMDFLKPRVYCTTFILGDFIKKRTQNGRTLLQEQYITKHLCIKFTFLLLNDTEIGKIFGTVCTVLLPLAVAAKS